MVIYWKWLDLAVVPRFLEGRRTGGREIDISACEL
jgi:hypothetical protein